MIGLTIARHNESERVESMACPSTRTGTRFIVRSVPSQRGRSILEENKTIVRRYIEEGLNQRKLKLFDEILATDFANHSPRLGIVDREATLENFARIFEALPDRHSIIKDIIAEGDKVFVLAAAQGTHQKEIQGIAVSPSGKHITWEIWEMFRFSGGRIVERWAIHNMVEQFSRAAERGPD